MSKNKLNNQKTDSKNGSGSFSSGLGDQTISDIEKGNKPITVVFPFLASAAQGNELLYAIRAIEKNFVEDFHIAIIGDRPDWINAEEITVIEAECISDNPQIDTIHKLKLAISDERVSDNFIWMNDDIYMVSPVMLPDIQILTAQGVLRHTPDTKKVYELNRNKTIELLKSEGLPLRNYDTHTPFFYNKEKLVYLFEMFPDLDNGLLVPSVYFNYYYPDHVPQSIDGVNGEYLLRLVSKDTNQAAFDKFIANKKFLNNAESGFNSVLINYLKNKFKEKSSFEV